MQARWACKPTAERILANCETKIAVLKAEGVFPHLAVILVGDNPASEVYVRNKIKTCASLGIRSTFHHLDSAVSSAELLSAIDRLNADREVHGILVQLPLPPQVSDSDVISRIDPEKDVDGFHPINVGRLSLGEPGLFPCTPMGVMELLHDSGPSLSGKHAVVVGRSHIVGKPMAQLLLAANCTVTVIHSRTRDPETLCREADIVVAAVGKPGLVTGTWLKSGAYVVDVGINELTDEVDVHRLVSQESKKMAAFRKNGRVLYGDVHYESAVEVAQKVTPVPGGVGQLTIAQLMANCVTAAERSRRS